MLDAPLALANYRQQKLALLAQAQQQGLHVRNVRGLLRQLSRHAQQTLQQVWKNEKFPSNCALVATGGFGRGELFPYSDVDVLLLLPAAAHAPSPLLNRELQNKIERFVGHCWDCGIEIGFSVRTAQECLQEAHNHVSTQTSLLDARWLAGSKPAFAHLQRDLRAGLDPKAFLLAKTLELHQRHHRFGNTPYALEPNCKESPGGLRDMHMLLWVSQAAGLGTSWDGLKKNGLATALEVRQIKANQNFLSLVRTQLHLLTGRREDRLVFDFQTSLAASLGVLEKTSSRKASHGPEQASEALMRRYYRAAKAVTQLNEILLRNIQEHLYPNTGPVHALSPHFFERAGLVDVARDDLYAQAPHAILETFLHYQQAGCKGLSARTLGALYNTRSIMTAAFRKDPVNRHAFMQILQQPAGVTHALRLMNQTSVLGRYLWAFRRIVGHMQHDLFHAYTVDQHILMVVRNLRRFFMAEHAHEYPLCSQLAAGWDKPWVLYVAALFHDIAKGRGGDHSAQGCQEARTFCRQHGVALQDSQLVQFLVAEHLSMSQVAQKEDLGNPVVIANFAKRVGNERYLTALYLLTVADIRGTSPKVWSGWKGKLLEDLYHATLRVLGGRSPDPDAEVEARKRQALLEWAQDTQTIATWQAFWATLDVGYFMRHEASDIAWHARELAQHVHQPKTVVHVRCSKDQESMQVLVYTPDEEALFARICGYFGSQGLSILDAKIHTARNGYALDTFQVFQPGLAEHGPALGRMVAMRLQQVLERRGPLPKPGTSRVSRRVKHFPVLPQVHLQADEQAQSWLLTVSTSDRIGLLYAIALVLARHRINLRLAKVMTLGERVEDTFLLEGEALQNKKIQHTLETQLLQVLQATSHS